MTGRKPVTANHLHLRPRTDSSGVKAHIGRELQPSPNLCVLLPRLQTTLPHLCLNSQLSWLLHFTLFFVCFFGCSPEALFSHLCFPLTSHSHICLHLTAFPCLLILAKLFTADTLTFLWREHILKEKHTSALSTGHTSTTACAAPGVRESVLFCFLLYYYLQLCQCILLLCIYGFKTDNRGYALPLCNAVHMCIFLENLFFRGVK